MTDDLTVSFFEGTPSSMLQLQHDAETDADPCCKLQHAPALLVVDATASEAKRLEKQAYSQASGLFETLREIHERKAWQHLGATSFDQWYSKFKTNAKHVMDIVTFYRKLAHQEVKTTLQQAGVETRNLTQQQAYMLHQLPPGLQSDAYKLAQETSDADPPEGKSGEFHHPLKVYIPKLESAIATVTGKVLDEVEDGEPDPFDPNEPANAKDFFAPQSRAQALNAAKPLPPSQTAQEARTEPGLPEEEVYTFAGIEESKEPGIWFVYGDDGVRRVVVPIRIADLREMMKK